MKLTVYKTKPLTSKDILKDFVDGTWCYEGKEE